MTITDEYAQFKANIKDRLINEVSGRLVNDGAATASAQIVHAELLAQQRN